MNKQILKVGLVALTASMYNTSASAAVEDGTANAEILAAIILTETVPMNFGDFVPDAAGDTVTLTDAATPTRAIATGTLGLAAFAAGAIEITATGGTGLTVDITIADGISDLSNGTDTLTFTPGASSLGATHVITETQPADTIYVGGTLGIPAAASAGVYTSAFAYTVTVNFQ